MAKQFAKETLIDWFVIGCALAYLVWLSLQSKPMPAPGAAIGALAAMAAIMTFSHPTRVQRTCVIVIAVGLYTIEMKLIDSDRRLNQQSAAQQFGALITQGASINTKSQQNLTLTNKALLNITGGNSFSYVVPQPSGNGPIRLVIWNAGKYPLTGVNVQIIHADATFEDIPNINIGTLAPRVPRTIPFAISPKITNGTLPGDKNYFDAYIITMSAQNGVTTEILEFRPAKDTPWAFRFWVRRENLQFGPRFEDPSALKADQWSDERRSVLAH